MKILITGCAGFIGYHISQKLLKYKKYNVIGIDNIDNYYDVNLKIDRLNFLKKNKNFRYKRIDISNKNNLLNLYKNCKFDVVLNLAAQAGVRYSIENPQKYFDSNLIGFFNILEASRIYKIKHLIFASTSSVYGDNKKFPLKEDYNTDKPLSFYAATKKSNEVMAYSYSSIYNLPITALRFFTVYGPFGRPDMSLFKFVKSISTNKYIYLFNKGAHVRDFTYIDDVVECIFRLINKIPNKKIPFEVFNIGSDNPVKLKSFLNLISSSLNKKPKIKLKSLQKGDVVKTHASVHKLTKKINFKPKNNLDEGIKLFISWYKKYFYE